MDAPQLVSERLRRTLHYSRLWFLEPILAHGCNVSTYSSLKDLRDETLYRACEGFDENTVNLLVDLRNQASYDRTVTCDDAAPQGISMKLFWKLGGRDISCFACVLVGWNVLSHEALSQLSNANVQEICRFALAQGFTYEIVVEFVETAYEAKGGLGAQPDRELKAIRKQLRWSALLIAVLTNNALERALLWSECPKLMFTTATVRLKTAQRTLQNKTTDILPRYVGELQCAYESSVLLDDEAAKAKQRGYGKLYGQTVHDILPFVKDLACWRACLLVGIADRERFVEAVNAAGCRGPKAESQMLQSFEVGNGHLPSAFDSNSSKDARRRGKVRPRRARGQGASAAGDDGQVAGDDVEGEEKKGEQPSASPNPKVADQSLPRVPCPVGAVIFEEVAERAEEVEDAVDGSKGRWVHESKGVRQMRWRWKPWQRRWVDDGVPVETLCCPCLCALDNTATCRLTSPSRTTTDQPVGIALRRCSTESH